jgi:FkbM family methyltransferase
VNAVLGNRSLGTVAAALFETRHYRAAMQVFETCERPADFLIRYLFGLGTYPREVRLKTHTGTAKIIAFSHHDILTINEIFCRVDYRIEECDTLVVDFGSNIGVSAAYFLSQNPDTFVYLYEPVAENLAKLKANLAKFRGRYELNEVAVGLSQGVAQFGWEPTGRYGGIGVKTGRYIDVPTVSAVDEIRRIIADRGRIDVLKIDIETMEREITEAVAGELAENIGKIFVEYQFGDNPLGETHSKMQYGNVARFVRQ